MHHDWDSIQALTLDIDGTLTDATTWWQGPELGWAQSYSVRDGEAIKRLLAKGHIIIPLSKNTTRAARERMQLLQLSTEWLGVSNKVEALEAIVRQHNLDPKHICHVGDGLDDAEIFALVGIGCAVRDAHPYTKKRARVVLRAKGGRRVMEEIETLWAV